MLHSFVQPAITKYQRMGGLNNRNLFPTVLEAGKSKIQRPLLLVCGTTERERKSERVRL